MTDPSAPHVAAELEPRFLVTVTLDGDDAPLTQTANVRLRLDDVLDGMACDGMIRAYTIERAP